LDKIECNAAPSAEAALGNTFVIAGQKAQSAVFT
jgi:hypothetical protein